MSKSSYKKTIAVTGGASGLGRATAECFARHGYSICVADINQERGDETVAALQALGADAFYLHCDVRSDQDIENLRASAEQRWGGLGVIINNAGVATGGRIETTPIDDWEWVISINLMGVVRGCKAFTPLFKKQGYGHIVNISSLAGLVSAPMMSSYNTTKGAVVSLSETLRYELEPFGINTSVVCPAFFQTNLAESFRTGDPGMEKAVHKLLASSKVTADDVANDIYKAVQNKTFYVLPHREGRFAWRMKKYLHPIFKMMVNKGYKKVLAKQGVDLKQAAQQTEKRAEGVS
ncbi:SDR family oxidoreductase [Parendozoicomonas sp. Alg238-R29]|uniref:SDR family oxidoreductase n=1 Tax=Parendozoicomonas sp. Alg238-R29 TaxID=2993446 RepID=UPI00248D6E24|nr:SDR family oxidoreductase [Parendozoicomonas sp. Alg238-R29]